MVSPGKYKKKASSGKKNKQEKAEAAATEETVATAELAATKEENKPEEAAKVQPPEIDIAQLFDIKLTNTSAAPKKGKAPKKDPMPAATKAVAASLSKDDDDDILKALDMYFEFKGPKSVMEISDEEADEDTEG